MRSIKVRPIVDSSLAVSLRTMNDSPPARPERILASVEPITSVITTDQSLGTGR